ncbi:orotate phosphoribosyltransferase [Candidatus Peregrinibacteria bacterium]|nr:orotate phosphoribosyltransferase [Candidatus Peregrinibacteria bacterium]
MKHIAEILLRRNAVRVSLEPPFQWTSGIISPVYCDNRLMTGYVLEREQIVKAYVQKIDEIGWKPTVIAGTATAAISWAAFVAAEMDLPMVYIRPKPKEHGAKKQIEGYLPENSKVVLVEDLFSTGGSSIASAQAIQHEGKSEILGVIAIMSWELPKCEENFHRENIPFVSLTGFSEIIPLAAERGSVSRDDVEKILEFRTNPENWWK